MHDLLELDSHQVQAQRNTNTSPGAGAESGLRRPREQPEPNAIEDLKILKDQVSTTDTPHS